MSSKPLCYLTGQVPIALSPTLWGPRQVVCQACGCGARLGTKATPSNGSPDRFPLGPSEPGMDFVLYWERPPPARACAVLHARDTSL